MVNVVGATTNLINSATSLGSNFGSVTAGLSLPAPNILSNYASYNYVISLHPLTTNDLNFPDTSYKAGKVLPIICKTAGADPDNRILTNYGKHDFFINNLTFESVVGYQTSKATNVSVVQFDVFEPYSIGLFVLACQEAAASADHENWRDAPFLLSIEFRGNRESGSMTKVPFSARHIPIRLSTIKINSTEQGTRYLINAYATQGLALTTEFANLRTDTVLKGKTIQEVLQTGEQSLQTVVNNKFQESVKRDEVKIADQIVILFPNDDEIASSAAPAASQSSESKTNKAYVNPQLTPQSELILQKIGVSPNTLQQSVATVNEIGSQSMGFGPARRGDAPSGNQADTWDPVSKTWLRGKLIADPATSTYKFSQDSDIPTVINQIILASSYAEKALAPGAEDAQGMVKWWRIDTQVYYVDSKENSTSSGKKPKIAVYRVVPFKVHLSKVAGVNVATKGFDQIKPKIVKRYDYIFTGKNTEVLKFDIDYSLGFANTLAADGYVNTTDEARKKATANTDENNKATIDSSPEGAPPPKKPGQQPSQQNNAATKTKTDGQGGGGTETQTQRIAKTFHDAITNPLDMVVLDLEILGDPYWIVSSGMGNYTAKQQAGVQNLCRDGSVGWQTGQVNVIVNFRTPIDINQITGMYDFKGPNHQDMTKDPKAGPAIGFTGIYAINQITSSFRDGSFRQTLKGFRYNGQEFTVVGTGANVLNSKTPGAVAAFNKTT